MKLRYCGLVMVAVLLAGCGKEERRQAEGFHKILLDKRASFAEIRGMEKDFIASARGWCESLIANGSGSGAQLRQNITVARDLAQSAEMISARVGEVRTAVYALEIQKEAPQAIRNTLITDLTRRQRILQEFRADLADAATGFEDLGQSRAYKGDSYPGGIGKLSILLQSYKAPGDPVADALTALTTKYSFPAPDLGT